MRHKNTISTYNSVTSLCHKHARLLGHICVDEQRGDIFYICRVLRDFEQFIERNKLCSKQDAIVLAVSGGLDSMVMMDLFIKAGYRIAVAHANFQLRGEESDGDEAFVGDQCKLNQIPFFSHRFDTANFATANHLSIQMAARELRYAWFRQLVGDHGFKAVATAHHRNDFVETVFLNLVHHQGLNGLTGIPVRNQHVIRPFLFATRNQIEAYAAEQTIAWREDESNVSLNYERNKIRHGAIPALKEINPSLEETIYEVGKMALGDVELVELGLESWKKKYVTVEGENQIIHKSGFLTIQHPATILARMLAPLGFHYRQCESMIQSMNGQPGKVFYSDSHQALIDRENLLIASKMQMFGQVAISEAETESFNGGLRISISKRSTQGIEGDSQKAFVDADKLRFPLTWRPWRDGDRFHPLGMEHSKKVSDFLIDQKVSLVDKEKTTVLESAGQIVWLVGYRIDDRVRITPETKTAVCFALDSPSSGR